LGTPIWQYFGLAVDEDRQVKSEDQAICQRTVMAKGSNTSNLQSPLKFVEVKQTKSSRSPQQAAAVAKLQLMWH